MTSKAANPQHVVVDGSNIATEGRSMPSLAQLNEAVTSYIADHPGARVTVVVDATFGHRIPKSEVREFDAAVANNELVAPPAGAVGRGDAFVLSIAKKANATILSNDSFQEFHGEHDWLFDEGRLVGGKPVPHVGWVWVNRTPVRGPVSRKSVRASKPTGRATVDSGHGRDGVEPGTGRGPRRVGKQASAPMPVPTTPPPGRAHPPAETKAPSGTPLGEAVNDLLPFLDFVQHHPVGTSVNAIVDSYASHGAYVRIGDILGYVPLRLMSDPPPRSAREVMKIGDAVTLVVTSFAPGRRSIDCAVPNMASVVEHQDADTVAAAAAVAARSGGKAATRKQIQKAAVKAAAAKAPAAKKAAAAKAPAAKAPAARKAAIAPATPEPAAEPAPAKRRAAKPVAKEAAATEAAAKRAAAPAKAPAAKAPAAKKAAAKAPAAKAAKKAPAKAAPAKSPARKSATKDAAGPAVAEAPATPARGRRRRAADKADGG